MRQPLIAALCLTIAASVLPVAAPAGEASSGKNAKAAKAGRDKPRAGDKNKGKNKSKGKDKGATTKKARTPAQRKADALKQAKAAKEATDAAALAVANAMSWPELKDARKLLDDARARTAAAAEAAGKAEADEAAKIAATALATIEKSTEYADDKARPYIAKRKRRIQSLVDFYDREYGKHLNNPDWFIRALAIIAVGKIDAPAMTERLLTKLAEDTDPLVRMYAWEALHARAPSLTDDQRRKWVAGGIGSALADGFRGDLRAPLIHAIRPFGPDAFDGDARKIILHVLDNSSHDDARDSLTLAAVRKTVAAWHDPALIGQLIARLSKPQSFHEAQYALGGLTDSIKPVGRLADDRLPPAKAREAFGEWQKWLAETKPSPADPKDLKPYEGTSRLIPAAEPLDDPSDPKWWKDLEMHDLKVNSFDLVFAIDATGSMEPPMRWVARSVESMMRAFGLIARVPRIGVTLFRHEIQQDLMKPCCAKLKSDAPGPLFRTMSLPLTGKVEKLSAVLGKFNPRSGSYLHPGGAVHGGLATAVAKQPWNRSADAKKVIVLIGDSQVTPGAEKAAVYLARKMKQEGWLIHGILLKNLPTYVDVVEAGGGKCIYVTFNKRHGRATLSRPKKKGKNKGGKGKGKQNPNRGRGGLEPVPTGKVPKLPGAGRLIARPAPPGSPFRATVAGILRSLIPSSYHDRIDPLVAVLLEYADAPPPTVGPRHTR